MLSKESQYYKIYKEYIQIYVYHKRKFAENYDVLHLEEYKLIKTLISLITE